MSKRGDSSLPLRAISSRDARKIVSDAIAFGCRLERTKGGHAVVTKGDERVYIATTVGRGRGTANMKAMLKRKGMLP